MAHPDRLSQEVSSLLRPLPHPEDLTNARVYFAASTVLLSVPYGRDAHRFHTDRWLGYGSNSLVVDDYQSWCAVEFNTSRNGQCANPEEQRRLLAMGEAVIQIGFRQKDSNTRVGPSYVCGWMDADSLRAESPVGELPHPDFDDTYEIAHDFNVRHGLSLPDGETSLDGDIDKPLAPLSESLKRELTALDDTYIAKRPSNTLQDALNQWPADQIAIVRTEHGQNELVTRPHDHMPLFGAWQALNQLAGHIRT